MKYEFAGVENMYNKITDDEQAERFLQTAYNSTLENYGCWLNYDHSEEEYKEWEKALKQHLAKLREARKAKRINGE